MKKNIIIVVLITIFGIGITVSALSNSKLTKDIMFLNNDKVHLSYDSTFNVEGDVLTVYSDSNDSDYYFNSDNELVGYFKKNLLTNEKVSITKKIIEENNINEDTYISLATEFAKSVISTSKTSFSEYILTNTSYIESYNEFSYVYTKTIDGYKTNDSITISLDVNGNLSSFVANRQGYFDNYKYITIDESLVSRFVEEIMKANYNYFNYNIEDLLINFIDNKLVLQIYICIELEENIYSSTILYYEL